MADWYCTEVAQGRVPACRWEILACERYLHMRQEARKPRSDYVFSVDRAMDICAFMETMHHSKGFEGTLTIEPVQCWWLCAVFGFRERETGWRWVREANFWVPRKNGKTEFAKGMVLYCQNFEGEKGAEGVIIAGSERQADIPFSAIKLELDRDVNPQLREWLLAAPRHEHIEFRRTGADLKRLAGKAPNLDGLNPHVVLAEEVHAQVQEVIGVIKTSQGARRQPLWIGISTAGRNAFGPAFDGWKADQAILAKRMRADRVFIAMYAPDKGDEDKVFDRRIVEQLNPLYGVSLNPVSIETEEREARKSPQKLNEHKRTRANIWSRAAGNLFSVEDWDACGDARLSLKALRGYQLYVGVDLASHSDLNAACFMIEADGMLYAAFRYWIPERSKRFQDESYADQFAEWRDKGYLKVTKGSHVHHPTILADILAMVAGHSVAGFAFDDWQADFLMGEVEDRGYNVFRVKKTARELTRSTDDLVTRHMDVSRLQHDGNPISSWCAGNVVGRPDENDNVLPKKEKKGSKASIDGMDAAIVANAARLHVEAGIPTRGVKAPPINPYLNRGLAGAEA